MPPLIPRYYYGGRAGGLLVIAVFAIAHFIYKLLSYSSQLLLNYFQSHIFISTFIITVFILSFWYLCYRLGQRKKQRDAQCRSKAYELSRPVSSQSVGFYDTPEWKSLAQDIRIRDNFTCQQCGLHGPKDGVQLDVHHRTPRKQGGSDAPSNLVTLCHDCHMSQPGHEFMRGLCDKGKYADANDCFDKAEQLGLSV